MADDECAAQTAFLRARLDEDEARARAMLAGTEPQVWPWEVWITPGVRSLDEWDVQPSIGIAEYAPKAYRRIWEQADGAYPHMDYGWRVHDSAICVWSEDVAKQMLREVEAKRAILEIHRPGHDPCDAHDAEFRSVPCETVQHLAAIYGHHPDYRAEWKP